VLRILLFQKLLLMLSPCRLLLLKRLFPGWMLQVLLFQRFLLVLSLFRLLEMLLRLLRVMLRGWLHALGIARSLLRLLGERLRLLL
jgi:hypothetical protein